MRRFSSLCVLFACSALAGCTRDTDDVNPHSKGVNSDVTADASGAHTVNGSIEVPSGLSTNAVSTVNGSIHVGDNATLSAAHTVNGGIHLGSHVTATSVKTVNGAVSLGDGAHVSESVRTVNGSVTLQNGSEVTGRLVNVNGAIELKGAHVARGIETVNGDIDLVDSAHVEGGIVVRKPTSSWILSLFQTEHEPRIVIGPGSAVQGNLRFEHKVRLYVSDKATIGPVTGATPQRFSGDQPPG